MAKEHEEYLLQLFNSKIDVYTGGELVDLLCENFPDCSRQNARKIIETAVRNNVMQSSKPVTFGHKQYAYFAKTTQLSVDSIKEIVEKNRPGIRRVIDRFYPKGVISYYEIMKLAAAPLSPIKSKVTTLNQIVKTMVDLELAEPDTNWGNHYLVAKSFDKSRAIQIMQEKHEEIKLDAVFIPMFISWLKKHNIVTTNRVMYRNRNNPHQAIFHNDLAWDAVAYTNTTGYFEFIGDDLEEKQTCVVMDIKISSPYNVDDLMGFYDRIQIYRNSVTQNRKRKILPIIVANDAAFGVRPKIDSFKMLYFNLGTVFGERIYEIVTNMKILNAQNLINVEHEDDITERVEESLKALVESGQQDNLGNLKGELFERLMYTVFSRIFKYSKIRHSYVYNYTSEDGKREGYEYDYLIETDDEYIVIELKGYKGNTYIKKGEFDKEKNRPTPNSVKWFFGWTFPKIKNKLKADPFEKPVKGCYITTGRFDDDALEVLNRINESSDRPKQMDTFYDGEKLVVLLKKYNLNKEIDVIEQYYQPVLRNDISRYDPESEQDDIIEMDFDEVMEDYIEKDNSIK